VFCYSQVKSLLRDRLSGKASAGSNGKTSGGSSEKSEPSASVELNSRNFDELVVKSKDLWIVEFFAPWYEACCAHTVYHIIWVIVHSLLSVSQIEEEKCPSNLCKIMQSLTKSILGHYP
jgi:hypothetical protein